MADAPPPTHTEKVHEHRHRMTGAFAALHSHHHKVADKVTAEHAAQLAKLQQENQP